MAKANSKGAVAPTQPLTYEEARSTTRIIDEFLRDALEVYGPHTTILKIVVARLFEKRSARHSITEVARIARLPMTSASRLLGELAESGVVKFTIDEDDERKHIYTAVH